MAELLNPEILIIGAGPGGSAAAWALAQAGHDVLMIDMAEFPRDKTCGDGLTPMALENLQTMGVLDQIEDQNPAHVDTIRIVGPYGEIANLPITALEAGYDYALILPRLMLDNILRENAIRAGAIFRGGVRVNKIVRDGGRITAVECTDNGRRVTFHPKEVVLALGAHMGLLVRDHFIPEKMPVIRAIRGYYSDVRIPQNRFDFYLDRRLLPGYGWIFPLGDGSANIGIGTMPSLWATKKPSKTLLSEFVQSRAKEGIVKNPEAEDEPKGFPLRTDFPSHPIAGDNWVLIGESTGLVNPITGEGIDLALESGLLAAEVIHHDIAKGKHNHIGYQRELWERYGPLYNGMRALRDIMVTPLFMDYVLWLINQHDFLGKRTLKITQGLQPPQDIFHPLFILQFFMPISPIWVARKLRGWLNTSRKSA